MTASPELKNNFLKNLQETFQAHLLTDSPKISTFITGKTPEMIKERLEIYNNGYYACLLESLSADYGLLQKFMGDDEFFLMGEIYIKAYPSHYFSIDLFGQHLPDFLANTKPYQEKPYLSELAGFIWELNSCIDAPDGPILTMQELGAISQDLWSDMVLTLHPSLTLVKTQWNILPLWQALVQDQPLPKLEQVPNYLAVWRKDLQPYYCPLSKEESEVLTGLQKQQTFGEICDNLLEWIAEDKVASFAVNLLIQWLNNKMLSKVSIKTAE